MVKITIDFDPNLQQAIEDFNLIELGNSSFYSLEILSNIIKIIK